MNNLNNSENNLNIYAQIENEKKEKKRLQEFNTLNELLINIYKKQDKYLQNLNYKKMIPLSTTCPNIDLLKKITGSKFKVNLHEGVFRFIVWYLNYKKNKI